MQMLFVYGTLKQGCSNPIASRLQPYLRYVGEGTFSGKLFEVNGYPGAILGEAHGSYAVHGELYQILQAENAWPLLDEYEECTPRHPQPHEYQRKQIPIQMNSGQAVEAWVYLYNFSTTGLKEITSGKWTNHT